MATKKKLDIFLGVDNAQFKAKLQESINLLKSFQTTVGGVLGGAALGVSLKNLGEFAVNASKKFEQAQISFSKMLQSEKLGAELVNDIQNLANETPMTSDSLANNAKLLLNFNAVAADEVIPTLKMLGDITGGDKQRMDSLTLAFAQSASAGRLMGQDLLQMINAGFNPLQIMSEKTGKSIGELKDEMAKGKITTDMVIQAFKDATEAGGKFAGMMEAQSKSKAGLEATKADSLEILARTITDKAMPALKEFDQAQIDLISNTTNVVEKLNEWVDVNNQTLNAVKNTAIALTTAVTAFAATKKGADLAAAAIEYFRYQQALARGETTALALAMQGKLVLATKALIVQIKSLTAVLLVNPWTWIAAAIAGVAGAMSYLKNEAEKTANIIEDLNNKQNNQINTLSEAIGTIKELSGAENLNNEEKQKLTKAIDLLTEQFPKYADQLREELALKGEINKATAEQIANELTLQKVKELEKRRGKVEKVINNRGNYATYESIDGTTHFAYEDDKTKEYNKLQKEIANTFDSRQNIVNSLMGINSKTPAKSSRKTTSSAAKVDSKAAEKAQKEAAALRQALLDAELLKVRKNSEEEYQIELRKIEAKLALEKRGTAAYQQILNERTRLVQKHQEELNEIELTAYNNKAALANLDLQHKKDALELDKERGLITNQEYYNNLLDFEEKKYNIKLEGLNRQAEFYQNDLRKFEEIQQQKLILQAEYENEKLKLTNEATQAELQDWRDMFSQIGNTFEDNLSEFLKGNQTFRESCLNLFADIKSAFARMIAEMIAQKALLNFKNGVDSLSENKGSGGWLGLVGTAASFIKGFFADGGIVPGNYNQPVPIMAHGSEMVLNPLQQKNLWGLISQGEAQNNNLQPGNNSTQQPVIMNNITPVFQSLDPQQGQKMFMNWMKQSGIPLVRDSIKNNNHQMRDIVKGV